MLAKQINLSMKKSMLVKIINLLVMKIYIMKTEHSYILQHSLLTRDVLIMTQQDTLKLKYSHKKGFGLISIIITSIFKHSKDLINKLYLSTRSEKMLGGINLETHHLSRHITNLDVDQVCHHRTILILDTLSSKNISPWDYCYLQY